jgi:MYXO-CTERM domain-containing protein
MTTTTRFFALATLTISVCFTLAPRAARAQVTATCYVNGGRVVDAVGLAGTKRSVEKMDHNLHYFLYLPKGHDPAKKWPLIFFMHGSGEASNNTAFNNLTKHSMPRVVEDPSWNWPFIVVSPQIATGEGWASHATDIGALLDSLVATQGADPNRMYLTGLSYGGVGTYALAIATPERWAAIMPVTPGGGGLDGTGGPWTMRSKIVNLPIWHFHGTIDTEYTKNVQRIADLEASGASKFFQYDYALTDEYNDVVPKQALDEKHVFGKYAMIMHDVWYSAYGTFCTSPAKDALKTTQFLWLLKQSKDGSAYVDPRGAQGIDGGVVPGTDAGQTTPDGGAAGSAGGSSGSTGTAGGGAAGSTGTAGATGTAGVTGTAGSVGTAGSIGTAGATGTAGVTGTAGSVGSAGSTGTAGTTGSPQTSTSSGGCACATAPTSTTLLAPIGLAFALFLRRRRR